MGLHVVQGVMCSSGFLRVWGLGVRDLRFLRLGIWASVLARCCTTATSVSFNPITHHRRHPFARRRRAPPPPPPPPPSLPALHHRLHCDANDADVGYDGHAYHHCHRRQHNHGSQYRGRNTVSSNTTPCCPSILMMQMV